ncbi:hypothetical protein OE88DRAFT_1714704 [Heliocybe sulcata]|uniref:uS12 prolyl 3,4-dihydroxylase n=1 Tax=Heliocybe sulcata TaxID=5364 RepID=A0A5C3MZG6_9AGAM|nr:hypothetical protein OE88DRAFT_1714704 [Heliocybe sulcata]
MARRPRSPSLELPTSGSNGSSFPVLADPTPHLHNGLLDSENVEQLHHNYETSKPWKHVVVDKLFQDELLRNVKDEILSELSFTEKETDIYKVHQTGDLASLSFLTPEQISLLPSLLTLRDVLYSQTFRKFLQRVTGCGPLSGVKQDMSVNTYKKGCHLLNHDDVIGTRRVSYILYMPLPHYQGWQREWGGALELYDTKEGADGLSEPKSVPEKAIPPSWNQFIFFEVQPGKSFHSVEEVVVGEGEEDGRQRLSISGWFHAAQPGEEGYAPEPANSSYPDLAFPERTEPPLPSSPLSADHVSFLSEFLNPVYLQPRLMKALAERFVEESSLELHSFLCEALAAKLQTGLRENDRRDGLLNSEGERDGRIPPHWAGTSDNSRWALKGPPHKWRYCTLKKPISERAEAVSPRAALADPDEIVRSLQEELFPSHAFRAWLACMSRLLPLRYAVEARRFRPGLDYTLATSEEREARLDVGLDLTPEPPVEMRGKGEEEDEVRLSGWQAGEWGGWECYMAPHDEEDDPAVYRSSSSKKEANGNGKANGNDKANGSNGQMNGNGKMDVDGPHSSDEEMDGGTDDGQDESGTLLTIQPGFNRLLLVLRDERVMHFVKYVSAAADGSRWDICCEYEVGMVQEEDD